MSRPLIEFPPRGIELHEQTTNGDLCQERQPPGAYGDGRGGYGLTLRVRRTASGRTSWC